ncbi:MAG: hypothetical protein AAF937_05655 [Planctomycetota bacterium]
MSTIGSGVAASAAAQSVAERQSVAKKAEQDREKAKLRRDLEDRFSRSNSLVEESGAAAAVEGDEESPADAKERERTSERQRNTKHDTAEPREDGGHIDVKA